MVDTHCPDAETLKNLLLGRLSLAELEDWETHMLTCEKCEIMASSVHSSDEFTQAIQTPSRVAVSDEGMEELLHRGRQIYEETRSQKADETAEFIDFSGSTHGSDAVPVELAKPFSSFLDPPQNDDELGRLGGYRILKLLGRGGMGMVFLAEEEALHRHVALKVMSPALAGNESARNRFLREARSMAAVVDDHIVPIHQVGNHNQLPFLAMPVLEGESLHDCLKREKRLPIDRVCRIAEETARGLVAAQSRGLIHRDIKPDNIWLESPSGRVKILDFGLARGEQDAELTHSGAVLGTPRYMSPEQAEGNPVDYRADLFSLGSVLYHTVSGQAPFRGPSMASTLVAVVNADPEPVSDLRADIPAELSQLIMELLAKDPQQRPASAELVAEKFGRLRKSFGSVSHGAPPISSEPSPGKASPGKQQVDPKRRTAFGVYTLGAAIALGLVAVLASLAITWNTPYGTVYVTIDSADKPVEIKINEASMDITDPNDGKQVRVAVDKVKQQLTLSKDGFVAVTSEFSLSSPDGRKISVKFEPAESTALLKGTSGDAELHRDSGGSTIATHERQIAEWLIARGASLSLRHENSTGSQTPIDNVDDLPTEDFWISQIALSEVSDESEFEILAGLSHEVSIAMPGTNVTGECFKYFAKIPKLASLNLQSCRNLDPSKLRDLLPAEFLESVLLLDSNLGDEVAELALQVDSLFAIEFGSELTVDGLKALHGCQALTEISVLGCVQLRPTDLTHVQYLPNLSQITIDPSHISAESIACLHTMPGLKILRVNDLKDTGSLNVADLIPLASLDELDLSYTVHTAKDLEPLGEMQSLKRLGLRGAGLTEDEVANIKRMLPNCDIYTE